MERSPPHSPLRPSSAALRHAGTTLLPRDRETAGRPGLDLHV